MNSSRDDREEFLTRVTDLVRAHRAALVRIARAEGLSVEDAFDAAQDAFQTFLALPQAATVSDAEGGRKLLVTVTRNLARNRRRAHAVARPHVADDDLLGSLPAEMPAVDELLESAERHVRLDGCMRSLAEAQRTVVTLRMLEDASGEDVARRLGLTPTHVAVLLHRAKANLLACMTTP